jgi:hypothetical protein
MTEPKFWKFYFPGEGESAEDATVIEKSMFDAEDAAQCACEYDFDNCDGWERSRGSTFTIAVIAPDGTETLFDGSHEPSVDHVVRERTND